MKTYKIDINSDFDVPNINLTIGNFDGVHVAHRKIIQILVEQSKEFKVDSDHPHGPESRQEVLDQLDEKVLRRVIRQALQKSLQAQ